MAAVNTGFPNSLYLGPSGQPLGRYGPPQPGTMALPAVTQQASGAPAGPTTKAPLVAIAVAIGLLVLVRLVLEYLDRRSSIDASRIVTPSIWNFAVVTLMVTLGIAIEALVFNRFYVPGWTEITNTVA